MVPVARMARLLDEQPDILDRVFTPAEQRYCQPRRTAVQHYAVRFAAKEAVVKALGTGMASGMEWTDVEVTRPRGGPPTPTLHGRVAQVAAERGLASLTVSLSHTADLAIAQAVATFTTDHPPS